MSEETWNVEETETVVNKIYVAGEVVARFDDKEITAEDVKAAARSEGYKTVSISKADGTKLLPTDFPLNENVFIEPINKAA
jgi:hypothetical protein